MEAKMGFTSIWHWLIVLVIVVVLFGGRGKLSALMGDLGTGLRNFKKGMNNDEESDDGPVSKRINGVVELESNTANEEKADALGPKK
jgi:sec-independent protein translocase protein TatA